MYSIEELSKELNLEPAFIRKCKFALWENLKNEIKNGNNNKDLFSSNAFVIFQQIAKFKAEGYSIKEITKQIEKELKNSKNEEVKPIKIYKNSEKPNKNENNDLLNQVFELNEQLLNEKDNFIKEQSRFLKEQEESKNNFIKSQEEKNNRIIELSEVVSTLKNELKLLPEGKSPTEIKTEWEKAQINKFKKERLIDELYSVGVFSFWKRKKIYEEIKKLDE